MPQRVDFTWIHQRGKTHPRDGNSDVYVFERDALVHASGRILAFVHHPYSGECTYDVQWGCSIEGTKAQSEEGLNCVWFIDEGSAKKYAEEILEKYGLDEPEPAKKKKPAKKIKVLLTVE